MQPDPGQGQISEAAYDVFVSSVMRKDAFPYRNAAYDELCRIPGVQPWMFERAPSSSEDVRSAYLRRAGQADGLVLLLAGETTQPVIDEVAAALARHARIWVFLLPGEMGDATLGLIERLKSVARYRAVTSPEDLSRELSRTFTDEFVRALRGFTAPTRRALIENMIRHSRARCAQRWRALGVAATDASEFAEDPALGAPNPDWWPTSDDKVIVLAADFGAGKSLAADRMLQRICESCLSSGEILVPLWVRAEACVDNLERILRETSEGIGDPRVVGAFIVVDGLDEVSSNTAQRIVSEAQTISESWPNTRFLLTSRPIHAIRGVTVRSVRDMTTDDVAVLVERVSHGRSGQLGRSHWSESLEEAVHRPVFAILFGLFCLNGDEQTPQSQADLLDFLVDNALRVSRVPAEASLDALEELATRTLDGEGGLTATQLRAARQLDALISSGLVVLEDGAYSLPLPIITQWFGAQALLRGRPSVSELLQSPTRLDQWRYALMVAVSISTPAMADALLSPIAAADSGFASQLVHGSVAEWGMSEDTPAPPTLEAGRRVYVAMKSWVAGIGPLARQIAPLLPNGELQTLGAKAIDAELLTGWYSGPDHLNPVIEFPENVNLGSHSPGWDHFKWARPAGSPAWSWRWSLEDLLSVLKRRMDRRDFPTDDQVLLNERQWAAACAVLHRGTVYNRSIDIDELERELRRHLELVTPDVTDFGFVGASGKHYDLLALNRHVRTLRADRLATWDLGRPLPDLRNPSGRWFWSWYSRPKLIEVIAAVFRHAVPAYMSLVERWFPTFIPRLLHYQLFPAVVTLTVTPLENPEDDRPSVLSQISPRPRGSAMVYDAVVGYHDRESVDETALQRQILQVRPEVASWLWPPSFSSTVSPFIQSDAVTTLVYRWLSSDLERIGWLP